MHWIIEIGAVTLHLLAYFAVFRHVAAFRREVVILRYHLAFGMMVLFGVTIAFILGTISFAAALGLLALQLVYSMSFLEAWSLAQGSYSLQILDLVALQPGTTQANIIESTVAIGERKKSDRLDDLLRLGLVAKSSDEKVGLTGSGTAFIRLIRLLLFWANIKVVG